MCRSRVIDLRRLPPTGRKSTMLELSLIQLKVTIDHLGNPMGWGDVECIDNALERHIEPCGEAQDVCVAEMEIDWRPSGLQTVTVRRGCANSANLDQEKRYKCSTYRI